MWKLLPAYPRRVPRPCSLDTNAVVRLIRRRALRVARARVQCTADKSGAGATAPPPRDRRRRRGDRPSSLSSAKSFRCAKEATLQRTATPIPCPSPPSGTTITTRRRGLNRQTMSSAYPLPTATLHALPHADGSATYAWHGYAVAASVNGPLEAQRRDELPDGAALEVHVRPASGGGGASRHPRRAAPRRAARRTSRLTLTRRRRQARATACSRRPCTRRCCRCC